MKTVLQFLKKSVDLYCNIFLPQQQQYPNKFLI